MSFGTIDRERDQIPGPSETEKMTKQNEKLICLDYITQSYIYSSLYIIITNYYYYYGRTFKAH